jgi:hypothetical protein
MVLQNRRDLRFFAARSSRRDSRSPLLTAQRRHCIQQTQLSIEAAFSLAEAVSAYTAGRRLSQQVIADGPTVRAMFL